MINQRPRPLIETVRQRQFSWVGHTIRRDDRELAKIFALYKLADSLSRYHKREAKPLTYKKYTASLITSIPTIFQRKKYRGNYKRQSQMEAVSHMKKKKNI